MPTFSESFAGALDLDWTLTRLQPDDGTTGWTLNGDDTATLDSAGNVYLRADHDTGSADMFAEATITADATDTADGDPRSVLIVRDTSPELNAHTCYVASLQLTTGLLTFLAWDDGAMVTAGPVNNPVTIPSAPFTWRFEAEGDQLRGYIDDELVVTETHTDHASGTFGGAGVQRGETIEYGAVRVGALSDGTDPDPEPGGGDVDVVDVHQDQGTGGDVLSVVVSSAVEGDQLLAIASDAYTGDPPTISSSGDQVWDQLGDRLGDGGGEANQTMLAWTTTIDAPGTLTVEVQSVDMATLTVLHLRNADTITVSDHEVARADDPAAAQELGPVDGIAGGLLVGAWSGISFDGVIDWGTPGGMTGQPVQAVNDFNSVLVATEALTDSGQQTRTATAADAPESGFAGKLIHVAAGDDTAPAPDTAAERYGWGTPLDVSDEFTTPGAPDPDRWAVYGQGGNEGGDECWIGHDDNGRRCVANAEVVDDGTDTFLRISGDADGDTTGVAHRHDVQYGRWETRTRIRPQTAGDTSGDPYHAVLIIWPTSERWPQDGEYDWVEVDEGDTQLAAFLHFPHPPGPVEQVEATGPTIDLTDWHNYAFEWTADELIGWVDGVEWFRLDGQTPAPTGGRPLSSMPGGHLTIQLDNFVGSSGLRPAYMDTAWVRAYSLDGDTPPTVGYASATTGARLDATGTTLGKSADADGDQRLALDAMGTTAGERTTAAAGGLALDATGATAGRTATVTGRASLALDASGRPASRASSSTGRAPLALDVTGATARTAGTSGTGALQLDRPTGGVSAARAVRGDVGLALDAEGTPTGVPIESRVGAAALGLGVAGTGRKLADVTGTAGLALTGTADTVKAAAASGTSALALPADPGQLDRDTTTRGAQGLAVGTDGATRGRTADPVRGATSAHLDAEGTTVRTAPVSGTRRLALDGLGRTARTASARGTAPATLDTLGRTARDAATYGTRQLLLGTRGRTSSSGGIGGARGQSLLTLDAWGTTRRDAAATGTARLALDAVSAPLRPGRVTVTAADGPVAITVTGPGLRITTANA